MSEVVSAAEVLSAVYKALAKSTSSSGPFPRNSFYVIPGREGVRWILPTSPDVGKSVISGWRPYGFFSKIKWDIIRLAYSLHCLWLAPGVRVISLESKKIDLPGINKDVLPVIYVGTPGRQQKAVATLVSRQLGSTVAVSKIPLGVQARESLHREALMLKHLDGVGIKSVPSHIASDEGMGWSVQSVVDGVACSGRLTNWHVKFLIDLRTGSTTDLGIIKKKIAEGARLHSAKFTNEQKSIITAAIQQVPDSLNLPSVIVHGDFSPWNIKCTGFGIRVFDWEDARKNGIPLWDLCHFYLIQEFLLGASDSIVQLNNSKLVGEYLSQIGIDVSSKKPLMLTFLLFALLGSDPDLRVRYKRFLVSRISTVIKA